MLCNYYCWQVLQRQLDLELDLFTDAKETKGHTNIAARVTVNNLNSQPVDYEGTTGGKTSHHSGKHMCLDSFLDY